MTIVSKFSPFNQFYSNSIIITWVKCHYKHDQLSLAILNIIQLIKWQKNLQIKKTFCEAWTNNLLIINQTSQPLILLIKPI